jgi:hypothetical protein
MVNVIGPLADLAAGLRARAGALREAGQAAETAARSCGWTGHRGDLVRHSIAERRAAIEGLAWEYEQLANRAEAMGFDFGQAIKVMHRYENDVRAWLAHAPAEQLSRFSGGGHLPPSGSPEWKRVLAQARAAGAAL